MKVLFIGDSLIRGNLGVNWVRLLTEKHREWKVENAGANGETMTNISSRLKKKLCKREDYDFIVLLAGANDILLPSLADRGFFYKRVYEHITRKGNHPLKDTREFETALRKAILYVKQNSSAVIVLTTISCLNEDLTSPQNKRRQQFNMVIRELAAQTGCRLADAAALCDGCLHRLQTKDYFLKGFLNVAWLDKLRCLVPGSADALSRKRKLHLTIDGLHPNTLGARFYMEEIEKQVY